MPLMSLKQVWDQKVVPVVLRRDGPGEKLRIRLPRDSGNRQWLQHGKRIAPQWNPDEFCWEVPKAWFDDFVEQALSKYRRLYIIQPYREHEKCAPACQNAQGHECNCSCMGANHGQGNDGSWFEVSDTFSFRVEKRHLACRLLTVRS